VVLEEPHVLAGPSENVDGYKVIRKNFLCDGRQ